MKLVKQAISIWFVPWIVGTLITLGLFFRIWQHLTDLHSLFLYISTLFVWPLYVGLYFGERLAELP